MGGRTLRVPSVRECAAAIEGLQYVVRAGSFFCRLLKTQYRWSEPGKSSSDLVRPVQPALLCGAARQKMPRCGCGPN